MIKTLTCVSIQSKLLDHDNIKYLKKILDELEKVLDQVETELQRRNEETPGKELFLLNPVNISVWGY